MQNDINMTFVSIMDREIEMLFYYKNTHFFYEYNE